MRGFWAILIAIWLPVGGVGVSAQPGSSSAGYPTPTSNQPGYVINQPSTFCPGMGVLNEGAAIPPALGAGPGVLAAAPAIAVDDSAVYIARGDQLLKLDKSNLALLVNTTLQGTLAPPSTSAPNAAGLGPAAALPAGLGPVAQPQAIAVDTASVYVLSGNTLRKFDKHTMRLEASAELPPQASVTNPQIRGSANPAGSGTQK